MSVKRRRMTESLRTSSTSTSQLSRKQDWLTRDRSTFRWHGTSADKTPRTRYWLCQKYTAEKTQKPIATSECIIVIPCINDWEALLRHQCRHSNLDLGILFSVHRVVYQQHGKESVSVVGWELLCKVEEEKSLPGKVAETWNDIFPAMGSEFIKTRTQMEKWVEPCQICR